MLLKCLGSGSKQGNCHALYDDSGKILLLDLGVEKRKILKGTDFRVSDIVGCVVTHGHSDHSKSIKDFRNMGVPIFAPYEQAIKKPQAKKFGSFHVTALPMLDKGMEVWQHTNAKDMSQCPIYGFLIECEGQKLLYITDCKLCVWNFRGQGVNHILLGVDFQSELLPTDTAKTHHVITGHMSLRTGRDLLKANATNALRSVILCHTSQNSTDEQELLAEVQNAAGNGVKCHIAAANSSYELSLYPF